MKNYPILYTAEDFGIQGARETYDNGVGMLSDIFSTKVTEELNGIYEFEFKYPVTGIHYEDIQLQNVVVTKANFRDRTQPFRIYKISKPIDGIVTVNAQHISYDLNGIPVLPFGAVDCSSAMYGINENSYIVDHNFVFTTDKSTIANFVNDIPCSARSILGGYEGSILDVYGGHYHFDRFNVSLLVDRGIDQGLSIRYGKNLVDISDEYDSSESYTGILPYWRYVERNEEEDNSYTVIGKPVLVYGDETSGTPKIKTVDFTEEFEEEPTLEQLTEIASEYISDYGINVPTRNISITYDDDPEVMNRLGLADPVNIYCTKLGINITARCVKTVFNPLEERFNSVEFGSLKSNIANTILDINTTVDEDRKQQILESRQIQKKITESLEGFSVLIDSKANSSEVNLKLNEINFKLSEATDAQNIKSIVAQMTPEEFGLFFSTISSMLEENETMMTDVRAIIKYIKAINGALVFGVKDENDPTPIKLKLMNNKIFFFSGPDDVEDLNKAFAYMTNNTFYVNKMNAASEIQIGNSDTVNFLWVKRENGHLSLRRQ